LYLSEALGKLPALSLSRGCNKFKSKYLKAFEDTNKVVNRGEMNYFIDIFLSILLATLKEMYEELKEKMYLINLANNKLREDGRLDKKNYIECMFILAQNHFFDHNEGLSAK